ncbi:MAG: hypothetical protein H6Q67_422 [Firmicutes bacterium]|nr:hypothetical protein [Bacillota bacterium]
MPLQKEAIVSFIRKQLSEADQDTLAGIAVAIRSDAETLIHSMIHAAIAQEKQHAFDQKSAK